MAQRNVIEAAQRGEPGAIAALLNHALKPHGVLAKAALKDHCLQILLEAPQVPSPNLVTLIQQGLTNLRSLAIHKVKVYGKELGSDRPQWSREFGIANNTSVNLNSREDETLLASNQVNKVANQVNKVANPDTDSVHIEPDRDYQPQSSKQLKMQESTQHFAGHFVPPGYGYDKAPLKIAGPGQCQLSKQGLQVQAFKQGDFTGFKPAFGGLIGGCLGLGIYFFLYQGGLIQTVNPSLLIAALLGPIATGAGLANGDNYQKNKKIEVLFPWHVVEYAKFLENSDSLLNDKIGKSRFVILRINRFDYNGDLYFRLNTKVSSFLEALKKQGVKVFGMEKAIQSDLELKVPTKNPTSSWLSKIIQKPSTGVILFLAVILFVFLGTVLSPKPQEFKSEIGDFSVFVPAALKSEIRSENLAPPIGKTDFYIFSGNRGNIYYVVTYAVLPEELMKQLSSDDRTTLYNKIGGSLRNANSGLVFSSNVVLDEHSGIEFVEDANVSGRDIRLKRRVYLVGNRFYQIMVIAPKRGFNDKEAKRYLNSFKLLSK